MLKRQIRDRRRVGSFCLLHSTGGFIGHSEIQRGTGARFEL